MGSRILWRRAAAAGGIYGAAVFGFLTTIVAVRELSKDDFALFAIVVATTGLLQLFLDLTVEEAVVKYGFRYAERGEWGRFRRLFRIGLELKVAGGAFGTLALVAVAFPSQAVFGKSGLVVPMLVASLVPLFQAPEGLAGAALIVRGRYDLRGAFLASSMALRLVAVAIGASFGVTGAIIGLVVAQALGTALVGAAGAAAFRRSPAAELVPIGSEAPALRNFVFQSSVGSGLVSVRALLPTVLIGAVATAPEVADFRAAQAPQTALASLSAPARLVLLAEQTRDVERGRLDLVYRMLARYMGGAALLAAALVPVGWFAMPTLVRWVYGERYASAVDAARLILCASAVQLVWGWTKSFPVSIGRPALRIFAHSVELAVLVPTLIVFADRWGATGAAGAVLLSTGVFALLWLVLLVWLRRQPLLPLVEAAP